MNNEKEINELQERKINCEICKGYKLGVIWWDGEHDNAICYECIDSCKKTGSAEKGNITKEDSK